MNEIRTGNERMPVAEPHFRISSFCHTGGCVAVAVGPDDVLVRSTQDVAGPVLAFDADGWTSFLSGLRGRLATA